MSRRQYDNSQRDTIKSSVSMLRVLELLGMEPPNRHGKIRSLSNDADHTPSLHIYDDHWYDFSTHQGGDQIEFVMVAKSCTYKEALKVLGGREPSTVRRRPLAQAKPAALPDLTDKFLSAEEASPVGLQRADRFITQRWPYLTLDDVQGYGVKVLEKELWIPHRDAEGYVRGIKVREMLNGDKYAVPQSRFTSQLYRVEHHQLAPIALIAEGESDTWCLSKYLNKSPFRTLVQTFGLPGGAGTWRKEWTDGLVSYKAVLVILDDDFAGQAAAEHIVDQLGQDRATSILADQGRVAESITTADEWLGKLLRLVLAENLVVPTGLAARE